MDKLLKSRQVAETLGLSTKSVDRMMDDGRLPYVRVIASRKRGQRRIPSSAVERYIASQTIQAHKDPTK